jgi:Bacteriophage replication gene A protein (GPA)
VAYAKEIYHLDKDRRVAMQGPWERNESLTPKYKSIAPDIDHLPRFVSDALLEEFTDRATGFGVVPFRPAAKFLRDASESMRKQRLDVGFDAEEIDIRAKKLARWCMQQGQIEAIEREAAEHQLTLPLGNKDSTPQTIALRCFEARTWRKSMEKNWTRKAENKLREIGFIEKAGMVYVSDLALEWYKGKMRAQERYLKSRTVSDGAIQLELWDVVQKSVSNKAIRRTELMTRMRGLEEYAKDQGDLPMFITLTCPSAYHARAHGRGHNQNYEGFTVRDGQAWMSKMWARARSRFQKLGVEIYGFRIAEPHHDGTVHWHLVLFCASHHRGLVYAVLRSRWLSEYASERGAHEHRAEFEAIESAKGSATGYIAKYIAKNIDAHGVDEDFEAGQPADITKARVTAWASIHGIRQFQQIGKRRAGVTLWREFRRERKPLTRAPTLEKTRAAADAHDYKTFIYLTQHGQSRLWKEEKFTVDKPTGEMVPVRNAFGELRGEQIVGIKSLTENIRTRLKTWRVAVKVSAPVFLSSLPSALGPVSITVPASPGAGSLSDPHGWTNPNETSMYGPN